MQARTNRKPLRAARRVGGQDACRAGFFASRRFAVENLFGAADFMFGLPALHQANPHWQHAAEAMMAAARPGVEYERAAHWEPAGERGASSREQRQGDERHNDEEGPILFNSKVQTDRKSVV